MNIYWLQQNTVLTTTITTLSTLTTLATFTTTTRNTAKTIKPQKNNNLVFSIMKILYSNTFWKLIKIRMNWVIGNVNVKVSSRQGQGQGEVQAM